MGKYGNFNLPDIRRNELKINDGQEDIYGERSITSIQIKGLIIDFPKGEQQPSLPRYKIQKAA